MMVSVLIQNHYVSISQVIIRWYTNWSLLSTSTFIFNTNTPATEHINTIIFGYKQESAKPATNTHVSHTVISNSCLTPKVDAFYTSTDTSYNHTSSPTIQHGFTDYTT
jgi:hypothetical protein